MNKFNCKSLILLCLFLMLFTSCGRRKGPITQPRPRPGDRGSSRDRPVGPIDTVYIVKPIPTITSQDLDITRGGSDIPTIKPLEPVKHKVRLPKSPDIEFRAPKYVSNRDDIINSSGIPEVIKDVILACNYGNGVVRNAAVKLVASSPGNFNLGQVCDVFEFSYQNWAYVNDPIARDYFAQASETIKNGFNGDCDDFAILLCSLIMAIGGETRINFAYDGTSGHAFTEVNMGYTDKEMVLAYLKARYNHKTLWYKEDSNGNWWLNLDWQGGYPGSEYWEYTHGYSFNILSNELKEI